MSILELYWPDEVNKESMIVLGDNIFANSLIMLLYKIVVREKEA